MGNYNFELDLETRNTMSLISRWISEGSKILEFGPANGRLTKYLSKEKKCSVVIVEIDENAGQEASQYALESYIGPLNGDIEQYHWMHTKNMFDYIIFADVLEHLSNPMEVLKRCTEVLCENGEVLVSIPNISHNSIIIDLFNDKFNYDEKGLLDKTHIHFFTKHSFLEMVKEVGLFVYQIEPIYSRVGNNEINNTYFDVPVEMSKLLRKRKSGSIYQYVIKLGKNEEKLNDLTIYSDIDMYEDQESKCYWMIKRGMIQEANSFSKIYSARELNNLIFDFPERLKAVDMIRWDPMENSCVIVINECYVIGENEEKIELFYQSSNASFEVGNFFCFLDDDPQLFFKVEKTISSIKRVVVRFGVIGYRIKDDESLSYMCKILDSELRKKNEDQKELLQKMDLKLHPWKYLYNIYKRIK